MTKELTLQNYMVALVDDEDIDRLNQFNWTVTLSCKRYLYVTTKIENGERKEPVSLQQFILNKELGENEVIIFENKNELDFRKSNLKIVSKHYVQQRRAGSGKASSRYKGVSWQQGYSKWMVQIKVNGKPKYIGRYDSEVEAALVYNEAALKFHGEHAFQNVIDTDNFTKEKTIVTGFQARTQKRKRNSKFRGVYKPGKKWAARIKGVHIGTFDNEEAAAKAYNKAAQILYGDMAILNDLKNTL